ncbi:MAG: SDR family oxidoreductase [Actinobacteria bacterium]|nr:SDR family oxidoreductase [Actinomycetota bacterium]
MEIQGAAALVTGGNRGIGEALVRALLDAGAARVYVGTRDVANAAALVDELGERAVQVRLDITDADQVVQAARRCSDISILVNNAGAFTGLTLLGAPDIAAAREEMETNYFGPLAMCRSFAPVLARHPQSAIVNVLSAGGLVAVPAMGGYSPSKFAARAMTTCVRAELAPQGTAVSALIVGSVDTRMAADVVGWKETPANIASHGVRAIRKGIDEIDTDLMAVEVRAHLARDPKGLEAQMARGLGRGLSTGR